eukprot:1195759-Alexandrium_andersonii.AAC.1
MAGGEGDWGAWARCPPGTGERPAAAWPRGLGLQLASRGGLSRAVRPSALPRWFCEAARGGAAGGGG